MLTIGIDIGSTTVKAVVVDEAGATRWKRYLRHRTKQLEKTRRVLCDIRNHFDLKRARIAATGSGGAALARTLGIRQHQEVIALRTAVERFHPESGSVFELGGQDAKYLLWRADRPVFSSMNDRCAGGTGATIDRIVAKLGLTPREARGCRYDPSRVYPVAAKCGVFAETDINGLQKQGVSAEDLMASLFHAVVEQNLSVLTRGRIPLPPVLLLGGPNVYFPALRECWRHRLDKLWHDRGMSPHSPPSIIHPPDALFFGALGTAFLDAAEGGNAVDLDEVDETLCREKAAPDSAEGPLFENERERRLFFSAYGGGRPHALPPADGDGLFLGIDGGSTSTKGVLIDGEGNVVSSAYRPSGGDPVEDTRRVLKSLHESLGGGETDIGGVGYTGYAKDLLGAVFGGTLVVVETVAHTRGALRFFPDAQVICDVGGQDIKIILLKNGRIRDFRLNTQCSAGNGYYLQTTAERFGYAPGEFADTAFSAERTPRFNVGCAVFLEADIVTFQQKGWRPHEIMAGLARILPQNVWQHVVREPNMRNLGLIYVLQGGTHRNLAVVQSQIRYIRSRVPEAEVRLHPHGEVAGAIGAALEAKSRLRNPSDDAYTLTRPFGGFHTLDRIACSVRRDESTRCGLCTNRCMRTFIDVRDGDDTHRSIIARCERGQSEAPLARKRERDAVDFTVRMSGSSFGPSRVREKTRLSRISPGRGPVIGIPRVLNMYGTAVFFRAYFENLGVERVIFSDVTSDGMYRRVSGMGCIDPCFPSKVSLAHVVNLLDRPEVTHVFFPCIRTMRPEVETEEMHWACAALAATPEAVRAALHLSAMVADGREKSPTKGNAAGGRFLDPVLDMAEPDLLERQLYRGLHGTLGMSRRENREALVRAMDAWASRDRRIRAGAEEILYRLEGEGRIGIVLLARPYHSDPGINHGIPVELSRRGYPVFTVESLPREGAILTRILGGTGASHPMSVGDLWKRCFSENSSMKLWAARFTARHPNLIGLDLSSFRCGHDAMIYSALDEIFSDRDKPYFTFHEIDENKPLSAIRLRVETMDYFLREYRKDLLHRQEPELHLACGELA